MKSTQKSIFVGFISGLFALSFIFTLILNKKVNKLESAVQAYQEPIIIQEEVTIEIKTAKVTAYSCGGLKTDEEILMNCPSLKKYPQGRTATGTTPEPYKTVACDKANLGKTFEIEGIGRVKCEDLGGAIKGQTRFDLYVETVTEARNFGVKNINYWEVK